MTGLFGPTLYPEGALMPLIAQTRTEWRDQSVQQPRRVAAPLLPTLLAITAILPQNFSLRPGGIMLTMPRLLLLVAIPVVVLRLLRRTPGSTFRFGGCDTIVLLAGIWMFLSVCITQGFGRAVIGSSVMILEFCGGYFLVRTGLNRPGEAVAVARLLATMIALDGLLSVLDVLQNRPFMLDLAHSITGFEQIWGADYRHGMMRALGMQEHPIMLGTVSVIGAALSLLTLRGFRRAATLLGCLIGLATSDSSAPTLSFLLICGLLVYQSVLAPYPGRWRMLLAAGLAAFLLFLMAYPSPLAFLIMHMTSVPEDGFYRLLIWSLVGPLVLASPLVGLGLETDFAARFSVANTIDCFWLASAVNFGIVGSALFVLTLLTACGKPVRRCASFAGLTGAVTNDDVRLGRALGIIIFLFFFIGMTVHFWGTVWLLLAIVAAMRAHLGAISEIEPNIGSSCYDIEYSAPGFEPDRDLGAATDAVLDRRSGD